ncbi:MAG: thiamine-phosphate kinase [Dehalococcoidia bacterium]|nr:thiamine-phosphate kinase [Dehalococcoidia bacterium]
MHPIRHESRRRPPLPQAPAGCYECRPAPECASASLSRFFQYTFGVQLSQLGEFGLIARLRDLIGAPAAPAVTNGPALLAGIGDDCAVSQYGALTQFATTDTMVQGVHFDVVYAGWHDIGWKALAVNLSDIAAMGGVPDYALITLGLSADTEVEAIDDLYGGLLACAAEFPCALAGGDIVSAPAFFVTVALIGHAVSSVPYPNNALLRSAARPGDAVAVTGTVGLSAAGLALLKSGGEWQPAITAHLRPIPRLATGRLALEAGVRCGMDVSDGLAGDLAKLCGASGVAAEVDLNRVPVHAELPSRFPDAWARLALTGGEDYELLLVAPPEVLDAVAERSAVPVTTLGRIVAGAPGHVTVWDAQGKAIDIGGGWDHLAPSPR